jgi:hypothetical protein
MKENKRVGTSVPDKNSAPILEPTLREYANHLTIRFQEVS